MVDEYLTNIKRTFKHFKEVSIAEFFEKNRHLLGFDNPKKALLITVKELVDNSLDACEEAKILPEIKVTIKEKKENRYVVKVEDNGPGIPYQHVPNVFGSFLYGSKFHRFVATRGKQGIGVSAVTLYSQLTTGKPIKVITKTPFDKKAHYYEIKIDTRHNKPIVLEHRLIEWNKNHGTVVEVEIEGKYSKGRASVDEYIKLTALANPHANITYINPKGERFVYKRITKEIPELHELKPHPHGIEIGVLIRMLKETRRKTLLEFLTKEFSSIGKKTALEMIKKAKLDPMENPRKLTDEEIERLYEAMLKTKVRAPPAKVLVLIGEENIRNSLMKMYEPEFVAVRTRPPSTYRGLPFIVEVGIAYGGKISLNDKGEILRFANRVPLLYKSGECAITHAIKEIQWKRYKLEVESDIPKGVVIFVHISSVWIPYTSESKEAIAPYPEIVNEIKLALREVARKLQVYINKRMLTKELENKYLSLYAYGLELSKYLASLIGKDEKEVKNIVIRAVKERALKDLKEVLFSMKEIREALKSGDEKTVRKVLKNILGKAMELGIITEKDILMTIRNK